MLVLRRHRPLRRGSLARGSGGQVGRDGRRVSEEAPDRLRLNDIGRRAPRPTGLRLRSPPAFSRGTGSPAGRVQAAGAEGGAGGCEVVAPAGSHREDHLIPAAGMTSTSLPLPSPSAPAVRRGGCGPRGRRAKPWRGRCRTRPPLDRYRLRGSHVSAAICPAPRRRCFFRSPFGLPRGTGSSAKRVPVAGANAQRVPGEVATESGTAEPRGGPTSAFGLPPPSPPAPARRRG